MFDQFQKAVRDAYLDLEKKGKLDFGQTVPSTGKLRSWCLQSYAKGLSIPDKEVFNSFFKDHRLDRDLERIIINFDTDKFRPLRNFIKGEVSKPDDTVVKLLAVLIDFQPRPYSLQDWISAEGPKFTEQLKAIEIQETASLVIVEPPLTNINKASPETKPNIGCDSKDKSETPKASPIKRLAVHNRKFYLAAAMLIIITCMGLAFFHPNKQCMCWVEDQYVEVECEGKNRALDVIALNEYQLNNFKKINRPDTLTLKDVNRVWYSKIANEVEFFTASGIHPIHRHKPLRAMSAHILSKYAGQQDKSVLSE